MRTSLKVIFCMAPLAFLMTVQSAAAQDKSLEGVWKITEITLTGSNARTVSNPQPSLFIFTKKHYSAMVIIGDKPRPDLPQDAPDAQKVAVWTPFNATAGTYEVKGTTLILHGIVSKNPGSMAPGNFGTWDFIIYRNTIKLTARDDQAGPVANPLTLKLTRVE